MSMNKSAAISENMEKSNTTFTQDILKLFTTRIPGVEFVGTDGKPVPMGTEDTEEEKKEKEEKEEEEEKKEEEQVEGEVDESKTEPKDDNPFQPNGRPLETIMKQYNEAYSEKQSAIDIYKQITSEEEQDKLKKDGFDFDTLIHQLDIAYNNIAHRFNNVSSNTYLDPKVELKELIKMHNTFVIAFTKIIKNENSYEKETIEKMSIFSTKYRSSVLKYKEILTKLAKLYKPDTPPGQPSTEPDESSQKQVEPTPEPGESTTEPGESPAGESTPDSLSKEEQIMPP